jgi:hypothetical protein
MRELWIALCLLSTTTAPVGAQDMVELVKAMGQTRFGNVVAAQYTGSVSWNSSGGSWSENRDITITQGQVQCLVVSRSPQGTFTASGPGLIDISLGLDPDEEAPASQRTGKWYSFRIACPRAGPNAAPEPDWSDPSESYKQPGGEVGYDASLKAAIVPPELQGGWNVPMDDGSGHTSMRWRLCRVRDVAVPFDLPETARRGCPPPPRNP